jgi:polyhydroxyalkanoate synthesis regulator protein
MRRSVEQAMGGFMPFPSIEEVSKQNMAMMERAMSLFAPFRPADTPQTIESLKAEVESLRRQLAEAQRTAADTSRGG